MASGFNGNKESIHLKVIVEIEDGVVSTLDSDPHMYMMYMKSLLPMYKSLQVNDGYNQLGHTWLSNNIV